MVNTFSDYSVGGGQPAGNLGSESQDAGNYWSLSRLKRGYLDYLNGKREEILEQQESRRYRHNSQWTDAQIKVLNRRKQPIVTYNRIAPKINGVIGLIEKLRQQPKGYARTPKEEPGADLATAVLRYVLDEQMWKAKAPIAAENGAVDGLGGIELMVEQGDLGDPEIAFDVIENDCFFYDPRSYRLDFSDCRFMGTAKWLDMDQAKELFPAHAQDLEDSIEIGSDLTTNSDREQKWFITDGNIKRVRLVDHWYKMNGDWYWCIYTGSMKLEEGKSPFTDEKGKTFCKFVMFSANIDQDGDRYGFVRQFKSAQDEVNQRRSKGLHLLNSRRIIAEDGAFDDVEKTREEAIRPDGVIIKNKGFEAEFDDATRMQETEAQLKFLQDAKEELDSYGPTLSLIGEVGTNLSGRAISLQQQAGIAQLGPFILSYRNWKIRVYRAIWNAVRQYWTSERWIRVTDDEASVNYVKLNELGVDPNTGMPAMMNQISALDVDIIMDEGPDSINMMADTFDALNALAQNGAQVPADVLIELAPGIDSTTRKRILDRLRQPDPLQEQAKQLEIALAAAKVEDTKAQTAGKQADAMKTIEGDTPLAKANALKALTEAHLRPEEAAHQQQMDIVQAMQDAQPEAPEAPDPMLEMQMEEKRLAIEEKKRRMEMDAEDKRHARSLKEREFQLKVRAHNKQLAEEEDLATKAEAAAQEPSEADRLAEKMDQMGSSLMDAMRRLHENQAEIASQVNAPISVERDKNGRIAAVNKGARRMAVNRDQAGRISHVE